MQTIELDPKMQARTYLEAKTGSRDRFSSLLEQVPVTSWKWAGRRALGTIQMDETDQMI